MLKRCLSPLTLVNQVALIVMLSTAIGVAGMAVSGWLVQGVQGSAHAINKTGSLRMQSYRLLAAVPLSADDQKLLDEMEQTAFSPELTRAAERDGQQEQLRALQDYWHRELSPGLRQASSRDAVAADVNQFVAGLDRLVSAFDHTTEMRIERVVMVHRVMAIFMALLLVFTIIWLRARLLQPWKQLLSMARAVSQRDFTQRAQIGGRNEMAMLGDALNNMSDEASNGEQGIELAESLDPDLILLDLNMPGMNGLETLDKLREKALSGRIVVFSVSNHEEDVVTALKRGADGYLLKDMEPEDLLKSLQQAAAGEMVLSEALTPVLAASLRANRATSDRDVTQLTPRERDILKLIAQGLPNKMIARRLDITESTVKVHVKHMLKKMKLKSRVEAAVWVHQERIF
ncbi:TPA: two-component system response regulator NarL [Citrobacter amalonaticus]|nr:two-component system response regulator NarL [Citrobacter amalonaticus]HCB1902839.1 two-component system response regulator NarL [Citrobacter amalonaticus]